MKKLCLLFVLMMSFISVEAVKYRELGTQAKFSFYTFDSVKYLMVTFTDDKFHQMIDFPVIKFRLNNDQILRLENTQAGEKSRSRSTETFWGDVVSNSTNSHYIMFEVSDEIINMMKVGIKAIVINTIPEVYYYKDDETKYFGSLLFKDYQNLKDEFGD